MLLRSHRESGHSMLTHEFNTQRERLLAVMLGHQPDSREGSAGRPGASERLVVAMNSGNSEGAKGPQFQGQCLNE